MTPNLLTRRLNWLKLPTISSLYAPFFFLFLFAFCGCYQVRDTIEPQVNYTAQESYLKHLPPPFSPLSATEKATAWGKEYLIGQQFAENLDLYRAITTFKRAEFLLPPEKTARRQEMEYYILLSYYLGQRYEEATRTFDHSTSLCRARPTFSAYHDLLIILYESYLKTGQEEKAAHTLDLIKRYYPQTKLSLDLSTALIDGDLPTLRTIAQKDPSASYVTNLLETYHAKKKSVSKAQTLNAVIPGSGYLYVGQIQSTITAFLLNGLFIAATAHFFAKGQMAAGLITLSLETGWYFGGIYGAGQAAKLYNERLYERHAYPLLNAHRLFPVLMLRYGF